MTRDTLPPSTFIIIQFKNIHDRLYKTEGAVHFKYLQTLIKITTIPQNILRQDQINRPDGY